MNSKFDYDLLSAMMTNANMGWWEADLKTESYICSEYISRLLGLDEDGTISFKDFNKRILKEEQRHTTTHSFDNIRQTQETVYLLNTVEGPTWIRSKICLQRTDENGNVKVYGIAETQDGPDMSSASQALQERNRLLHNIYKYLPVGIELYNREGILIDMNDKEQEMFHLKQKEDLLGINIFENPIFPEEMKSKLRKHENADFTFRYDFSKIGNYYKTQKKTGTIDLVTKVTSLYDDNHNLTNYLLINADKTETTVAYNKIQEFESHFELIGDYAKVGYANYDLLNEQGYAQRSWYKNLGEKTETPLSEIIGTYNHLHPDDRTIMLDFLQNVKRGLAHKLSREVRVLKEDGSFMWTHVNIIVERYMPEQNIIEIICINYDITQLKQTEAMLIQAKEKPFDIVAAIELHGEVYKLGHRQRGTRQVVAAAVDAVGAVVDAIIGKHHFEQGDTTAVLGKTMADAPATHSVPQHACLAGAHRTTGGARDVILCRLCQYLQFIENVFIHNTCVKSSNNTFQKQKRPPVVAVFRSIKYAFFLTS